MWGDVKGEEGMRVGKGKRKVKKSDEKKEKRRRRCRRERRCGNV